MNKRTAGILPAFALAAQALWAETHTVPLFASAGNPAVQGFVRVVNLSDQVSRLLLVNPSDTETAVTVKGMDDQGNEGDRPVTVTPQCSIATPSSCRRPNGDFEVASTALSRLQAGGSRLGSIETIHAL